MELHHRREAGDGPLSKAAMGNESYPEGLHWMLALRSDYGPIPIQITGNGATYPDKVGPDGKIDDRYRLE